MLREIKRVDIPFEWDELVKFQVKNYERGINNVGISDLIILDNILKKGMPIFSRDKHFNLMKKVHGIELF